MPLLLLALAASQSAVQPNDPAAERIVVTARPVTDARIRSGQVSDADYPRSALRAGLSGTATVRFRVDAGGRVVECEPGNDDVDAAFHTSTCMIVRRFRFIPARAADGRAVPQSFRFSIRYSLPRNLTLGARIPIDD